MDSNRIQIGPYTLTGRALLAPMAGVTDRPFRYLCQQQGAALVFGEMVSANPALRHTRKSQLRLNHTGEPAPIAVQIAGGDAQQMAQAAIYNVQKGAHIIDINMGCPAKKVCNKAAGSALLKNEPLVTDILQAVVKAVTVPVTLKIRTGWDKTNINATRIAQIAEQAGISALSIHGRTRACGYKAPVDYRPIKDVVKCISIPVFANGDICTAQQAQTVLTQTGAAGILIGREAQGNPWIFKQINHFLQHQTLPELPSKKAIVQLMHQHLKALHHFYGTTQGIRIARKHMNWYAQKWLIEPRTWQQQFNQLSNTKQQFQALDDFFLQIKYNQRQAA